MSEQNKYPPKVTLVVNPLPLWGGVLYNPLGLLTKKLKLTIMGVTNDELIEAFCTHHEYNKETVEEMINQGHLDMSWIADYVSEFNL